MKTRYLLTHLFFSHWLYFSSVPVSRLPDLISAAKQDFEELGLVAPIAGHVGDGELPRAHVTYLLMLCHEGNFHALVLYADEAELALVREAVGRINRKAIELEGTCERCP